MMVVTFIVFPGVTCSTSISFVSDAAWFDLFMVTVFNVGDTIGRYIGGVPIFQIPIGNTKLMHVLGFARLIFVVISILIMLWQIHSPLIQISNLILFAFSNGYLSSIFFCFAPAVVDDSEQDQLGNLMVIMITLGVSVGGLIQIPLAKLV